MHTWKTKDNKQRVFNDHVETLIDINDYKIIQPDYYQTDDQDIFENLFVLKNTLTHNFFMIKEIVRWRMVSLILNHLCSLTSKRSIQMIESSVTKGNSYKLVMFLAQMYSSKHHYSEFFIK